MTMSLNEDAWLSIAQHLTARDIFALSRASKHPFFSAHFEQRGATPLVVVHTIEWFKSQ